MFDTKFCENRWRPFNFRRILIFLFFIWWYQIFQIRCVHEVSSVRKPKSSNVLPQRKNFVKSVRKQYGNPDTHSFFKTFVSVFQKFFPFFFKIVVIKIIRFVSFFYPNFSNIFFHQLIENNHSARAIDCTHTNTAFSTEIGRKV